MQNNCADLQNTANFQNICACKNAYKSCEIQRVERSFAHVWIGAQNPQDYACIQDEWHLELMITWNAGN